MRCGDTYWLAEWVRGVAPFLPSRKGEMSSSVRRRGTPLGVPPVDVDCHGVVVAHGGGLGRSRRRLDISGLGLSVYSLRRPSIFLGRPSAIFVDGWPFPSGGPPLVPHQAVGPSSSRARQQD